MQPKVKSPDFSTIPSVSTRVRLRYNKWFQLTCILTALISVLILLTLLLSISVQGYPALSWSFITSPPNMDYKTAGIGPSLAGSIWVCIGCAIFALPIGISTAIFLEEYRPTNIVVKKLHAFVQLNISNLAGVPSIVYGLLGLTVFANTLGLFGTPKEPHLEFGADFQFQCITEGGNVVILPLSSRYEVPDFADGITAYTTKGKPVTLNMIDPTDDWPEDESLLARSLIIDEEGKVDGGGLLVNEYWYYFRLPFGRSILAASLTLMLVILPIVIIATQEALRSVPNSLREGALGLGATQWQVIRYVTLPAAIPGIMTGAILSMSRAIGEAAPLLLVAGLVYSRFLPTNLMSNMVVLPLQIYYWAGQPDKEGYLTIAAGGIIVLLVILLTFNAVAIAIRQKTQKRNA